MIFGFLFFCVLPRRKDDFVSMLSEALIKNDSMKKSDVVEKFVPEFKAEEVEDYLSVLANEGRIMICEDVVFSLF